LRLSKLRLWTLRYFKEIFLEFPKILFEPKQEIQACVPLYLPFLVQLLRPEYTLNTIQRALKSKTLTRQDLDAFQQACHTRQSVPSLRFDSGGFQASQLPQESQALDHELGQALHIDKMFPADLNIAIAGYKVFDMSQELYQKASVAEKHQEICNRIERSNACITQYEWSDRFHLPAANQAIDDLVSVLLPLTLLSFKLLNDQTKRFTMASYAGAMFLDKKLTSSIVVTLKLRTPVCRYLYQHHQEKY
jgi:hypothetical protein